MPKLVLEDRPIWPVAAEEATAPEVTAQERPAAPPPPPQESVRPGPTATSGFEGFGSFPG